MLWVGRRTSLATFLSKGILVEPLFFVTFLCVASFFGRGSCFCWRIVWFHWRRWWIICFKELRFHQLLLSRVDLWGFLLNDGHHFLWFKNRLEPGRVPHEVSPFVIVDKAQAYVILDYRINQLLALPKSHHFHLEIGIIWNIANDCAGLLGKIDILIDRGQPEICVVTIFLEEERCFMLYRFIFGGLYPRNFIVLWDGLNFRAVKIAVV